MSAPLGRRFHLLLFAATLSQTGAAVASFTLAIIISRLTTSPAAASSISVMNGVAFLSLALPAGALADRWDRKRMLRNVHLFRLVVFSVILGAVATDTISIPLLMVTSFALGGALAFWGAAGQALVASMVDRPNLSRAFGRLQAVGTLSSIVGPSLAGLVASYSVKWVLLITVVSALGASVLLEMIPGSFVAAGSRKTLWADIREGLGFVWSSRLLRPLVGISAMLNAGLAGNGAIYVLFAVAPGPMGLTSAEYGVLVSVKAAAGLAGAALAGSIEARLGERRVLRWAAAALPIGLVTPVLTANVWYVGAASAVAVFSVAIWNVVETSLFNRVTPDSQLARVNSTSRFLGAGITPLGAAAAGAVGEALGLRAVFATTAVLGLLAAAWMRLVPLAESKSEPQPEAEPAAPPSD